VGSSTQRGLPASNEQRSPSAQGVITQLLPSLSHSLPTVLVAQAHSPAAHSGLTLIALQRPFAHSEPTGQATTEDALPSAVQIRSTSFEIQLDAPRWHGPTQAPAWQVSSAAH
jgi:hypothetical protein